MTLHLKLFGQFRAVDRQGDASAETTQLLQSSRALLAFLACEPGKTHAREALASLFWPDVPQATAFANLRQALARLRKSLPEGHQKILTVSPQHLRVETAYLRSDVGTFEDLLAECVLHADADWSACDDCMARAAQAVALYEGDLLAGLSRTGSAAFEEWLLLKREAHHRAALDAHFALAAHAERHRDHEQACRHAKRQLELEPWREEAHQQLMRNLALRGERSAALAQFEKCRAALESELGIAPSAETRLLYQSILEADRVPATKVEALPSVEGAPNVPATGKVFGRARERATLSGWLQAGARCIGILGMGGMGKSTLAAALTREHARTGGFERVHWVALHNATPFETALRDMLRVLGHVAPDDMPAEPGVQLAQLCNALRTNRCLLVLDNLESILQAAPVGGFRNGHEGYASLMRWCIEQSHNSCLIYTSREQPSLHSLADEHAQRVLRLGGINDDAGGELLAAQGLQTSAPDVHRLVRHYSGNPLALKLVGQAIHEMFGGDIGAYVTSGAPVFDDIGAVIDQHLARLTPLERELMTWLAIEREPVPLNTLRDNLIAPPSPRAYLDALRSLQRRSLIEFAPAQAQLQNVILEHMTALWIDDLCHAISGGPRLPPESAMHRHAILKAQSRDYVRQAQTNLIVQPVVTRLRAQLGAGGFESRLRDMLRHLRESGTYSTGYAAGTLLNLLVHQKADLRALDCSGLAVWQAFLRDADLKQVNFAGADLRGCVFADTFSAAFSIAYNAAAGVLACATTNGEVRLLSYDGNTSLAVLKEHTKLLWTVASNPRRAQIASGGEDGALRIWEPVGASNQHWASRLLYQSPDTLRSIAYRPDGDLLASAGDDPVIRLWHAGGDGPAAELKGHGGAVTGLAFGADGRQLASCADDGSLRIWNVADAMSGPPQPGHGHGVILHQQPADGPAFWCLAFSGEGTWLAGGTLDGRIALWHLPSQTRVAFWRAHESPIGCMSFSGDGALLATGAEDGKIRVWHPATQTLAQQLAGHPQAVQSVVFQPGSHTLASSAKDDTIRIWNADSAEMTHTHSGRMIGFNEFCWLADDNAFCAPTSEGLMAEWQWESGRAGRSPARAMRTLATGVGNVAAMARNAQGTLLFTGGHDHSVRVFDLQRGTQLHHLGDHAHIVFGVAAHPDGETFATCSLDQTVRVWHARSGRCLHVLGNETRTGSVHNGLWEVAYSPDGRFLAAGHTNGAITVWSVPGMRIACVLRGHVGWVGALTFDHESRRLISGANDHEIRIWDVATAACIDVLKIHSDWLMDFALHPTLPLVASGSFDRTVKLWSLADPHAAPRVLAGAEAGLQRVLFSPSGDKLAGKTLDGEISIWQVADGELLANLRAPGLCDGLNITRATGLSDAQRRALQQMGAVMHNG